MMHFRLFSYSIISLFLVVFQLGWTGFGNSSAFTQADNSQGTKLLYTMNLECDNCDELTIKIYESSDPNLHIYCGIFSNDNLMTVDGYDADGDGHIDWIRHVSPIMTVTSYRGNALREKLLKLNDLKTQPIPTGQFGVHNGIDSFIAVNDQRIINVFNFLDNLINLWRNKVLVSTILYQLKYVSEEIIPGLIL